MENLDEVLRELRDTPEGRQFLGIKRANLFRQLHEIVFFGKGGYDLETVYHLPIWLRRFIYSEITKHYKAEADAIDNASTNSQTLAKPPAAPVRKPDVTLKPRK